MPYIVDFENVSTTGLESSPVARALAGLRANEARYFKNKYGHVFTVSPASERSGRYPDGLRVLRVRLVHQRDVHHRGPGQARGRVQARRRHGGSRGAGRGGLQVRAPEVKAGGRDPRLL